MTHHALDPLLSFTVQCLCVHFRMCIVCTPHHTLPLDPPHNPPPGLADACESPRRNAHPCRSARAFRSLARHFFFLVSYRAKRERETRGGKGNTHSKTKTTEKRGEYMGRCEPAGMMSKCTCVCVPPYVFKCPVQTVAVSL